jgi:AhpD family alkylhydroperoxidase
MGVGGESVGVDREPRISPGSRRQIGFANALITGVIGRASHGRPPNVFTTLARNRGLFRRWLFFAGGLMPGGKLPRQDTELVILRVSHNTGCDYEWSHHERLAQRAGFSAEEVECVRSGPDASGWTPRQQLLLRACDEIHADGAIGEGTWAGLAAELDDRLLIELCLLIGHYEMLAMTLNSLRVQLDPPAKRIA